MGRTFLRANLALRAIRHISVFVIRAATQLGYCRLRVLELGISPTALVAQTLTLLCKKEEAELVEVGVELVSRRPKLINGGSEFVLCRPELVNGVSEFVLCRLELVNGGSEFVFCRPELVNGGSKLVVEDLEFELVACYLELSVVDRAVSCECGEYFKATRARDWTEVRRSEVWQCIPFIYSG
ncbi:hypothetical protein DY000_02047476 [Brassica cretica]|uniref:FBD domain-containing protein n=1 Tax=Brassica cretica TaxID=69181 RepID=A0ABQ7F8Z0_BRACR|nr:hypothetical protein DY000_02047476 [Brassica cretica]